MKKIAVAIAAVALSSLSVPAMAGETLTAGEVKALMSGARFELQGVVGGNKGTSKADGSVSASNMRNSSEGTWSVKDSGELCLNWYNGNWRGSCAPLEKTGQPDVYARLSPESGGKDMILIKKD